MFRLGLALAVAGALVAFAARAAPLEVYGRLPQIEAVQVSPDGDKFAVVLTDGAARRVLIQDFVQDKIIDQFAAGNTKVRALTWAGPDHLIITASQTSYLGNVDAPRSEYSTMIDYNLPQRKLRPLLWDVDRAITLPIAYGDPVFRVVDGKPVVFIQGIYFVDGWGCLSLFRINLESGSSRLILEGSKETRAWTVSQEGAPLAQSRHDDATGRWSLRVKTPSGWVESRVLEHADEHPVMLGLGRDGRSILMQEIRDGQSVLTEVSPGGVWGEPLAAATGDGPIFDPANDNLIGTYALVGDEDHYGFFDAHDQRVWNAVVKAYPGARVNLVSWSNDRKRIVVLVDSPTDGPTYALVDLNTGRADDIGARYAKLTSADLSPVKPVEFKAQDGLLLHGYLTTPQGADAKNLPLVVFPHGGPAARDEPGFDWWAQAMAARGYAVLKVNFRGSTGYGQSFLKAGDGQWGRKMQTDLSDGVRYLAAEGVIDPKRVCIVGASYGGYAALAGAALDSGVYRCAVSYAGIADLKRFTLWLRRTEGRSSQRYFDHVVGAESVRDPTMQEASPIAHIDRVTAPILLVHGRDDTTVPLEQSRFMAEALKAAGKPVEFLTLDGTDHWLTKGETRVAMLQATIAFLEKNNPPH